MDLENFMNLEGFLAASIERLRAMYQVELCGTGKNKIYFRVNQDLFTLTKDKSWVKGFIKIIIENGEMFPCVISLREDPAKYTDEDVRKVVDHIDDFFVKKAGLHKSWCLCNRFYYLRPLSTIIGSDIEDVLAYYACLSTDDQISFSVIAKKDSDSEKDFISFYFSIAGFMIQGENCYFYTTDYRKIGECLNFLNKKYTEMRLA